MITCKGMQTFVFEFNVLVQCFACLCLVWFYTTVVTVTIFSKWIWGLMLLNSPEFITPSRQKLGYFFSSFLSIKRSFKFRTLSQIYQLANEISILKCQLHVQRRYRDNWSPRWIQVQCQAERCKRRTRCHTNGIKWIRIFWKRWKDNTDMSYGRRPRQ